MQYKQLKAIHCRCELKEMFVSSSSSSSSSSWADVSSSVFIAHIFHVQCVHVLIQALLKTFNEFESTSCCGKLFQLFMFHCEKSFCGTAPWNNLWTVYNHVHGDLLLKIYWIRCLQCFQDCWVFWTSEIRSTLWRLHKYLLGSGNKMTLLRRLFDITESQIFKMVAVKLNATYISVFRSLHSDTYQTLSRQSNCISYHALISSRLDYSNYVIYGAPHYVTRNEFKILSPELFSSPTV